MLAASASGAAAKRAPAPARQHEPAPEDFEVPAAGLAGNDLAALLKFVQRLQEARVDLHASFDSRFEDLVTAGESDKYAELVDRFKLTYAAADASMEALAGRIEAEGSGPCAELVRRVAREEAARHKVHLQQQVLRQHHSLSSSDDPSHAEVKARLASARAALAAREEAIAEALDELRCEAADLD
jgi:hypothetical protein